MKKAYFSFLLFIASALIACSSVKVVMTEYRGADAEIVTDSIMDSGTGIGTFSEVVFTLDDGSKDTSVVSVLYRDNKAVGSIQIRKDSIGSWIKIIDSFEE